MPTESPVLPARERAFGAWIVAIALCVYGNTLAADFTLDDLHVVVQNPLIAGGASLSRIFATEWWGLATGYEDHSLYRPLTVASFALDHFVYGLRPFGYHLTNVVLHATASYVGYRWLRALLADARVAFAAALLFAVHPIHTEAVANVAGRAEILATIGALGCALAWERARAASRHSDALAALRNGIVAVSMCALGQFSKENGAVAPALILAAELCLPDRRWLFARARSAVVLFAALCVPIACFLYIRQVVTQPLAVPMGLAGLAAAERVPTALRVLGENLAQLCFPLRLVAEYTVDEEPIAAGWLDAPGLVAAGVVALLVVLAVRARRRVPAFTFGLCVFAVAILPASNVLFGIGVIRAERLLYLPSIGICAALAGIATVAIDELARSERAARSAGVALCAVCVAALGTRTVVRNREWHDNGTLGEATLAIAPRSYVMHELLAEWYLAHTDARAALPHVDAALQLHPSARMWFHRGELYAADGRSAAAADAYRKASALDATLIAADNNLALALLDLSRFDEAIAVLEKLRASTPGEVSVYHNLLYAHAQRDDWNAALSVAEDAVERFPRDAEVLSAAALVYQKLGRTSESESLQERARVAPRK